MCVILSYNVCENVLWSSRKCIHNLIVRGGYYFQKYLNTYQEWLWNWKVCEGWLNVDSKNLNNVGESPGQTVRIVGFKDTVGEVSEGNEEHVTVT